MNKKCPICDGQLIDKETAVKLKRYGQEFTHPKVRTEICQKCGEKFYDGPTITDFEREIRELIVEKAA